MPRRELAAIARRAENEFAGVPSGIMDQSASLLCEAGHALLLDCQSLEISQVPFDPAAAGIRILVIDTRAKHELADGEYGSRQTECQEAARRLGVPSLRAITDVSQLAGLDDPVLVRRARHVVTDNQRVLQVAALAALLRRRRPRAPRGRRAADPDRTRRCAMTSRCPGRKPTSPWRWPWPPARWGPG